jgi:DNA polymerase III sliding clamp (beta) subunit (PCNA family)
MSAEIKLYEFLRERECHLYKEKNEIRSWVAVDFDDLKEFAKVVDTNDGDGGLDVKMFNDYIAIELNDTFESLDMKIQDYEKCFPEDEYKEYVSYGGK